MNVNTSRSFIFAVSILITIAVVAVVTIPSQSDAPVIQASLESTAVIADLSGKTVAVPVPTTPSETPRTEYQLPPGVASPEPTPRPVPPKAYVPSETAGCQFQPIYDKWWLHSSDKAAYLAGLVEDGFYRTNAMFNWEGQFKFEIRAVSAIGVVLGSLTFDTYLLEPCTTDNVTNVDGVCSGMFQINKFVNQLDALYTGVYAIHVKPLGGDGRIFFYATLIDNRSSDCTTYTQFRTTHDSNVWSESGLYYRANLGAETETH